MIENGAKADVTEERFGCTPLHWAAALGITEICQILCKAGAQPHRKDKNGCDAIFYANQSKNTGCIEYLQSIRKYDLNISDSSNLSKWERNIDEQSGYVYYHNLATGHSMWEDEFIELKNQLPSTGETENSISKNTPKRTPPPSPSTRTPLIRNSKQSNRETSNGQKPNSNPTRDIVEPFEESDSSSPHISQHDDTLKGKSLDGKLKEQKSSDPGQSNTEENKIDTDSLSIEIPSKQISFSDSDPSPVSKKRPDFASPVTKTNFEERLVALQSKMEEQFVDQLKKIEDKIKNQAEISTSQSSLEKTSNSVSELSSKVIQLQSDIGTKDLQILSLRPKKESKLIQNWRSQCQNKEKGMLNKCFHFRKN